MDGSISEEGSFIFGPFLFRPDHQTLFKGDEEVKIGSRAVSILHLLVTHSRILVSKEDLIDHAWPKTTVDEANLKVHICALRRALGDTRRNTEYIATVPGRGYQFIAPVMMTSAKIAGEVYSIEASQQDFLSDPNIVGHDQEIEDIATALISTNVVTLAGPVGVGKASVARAAAAKVRSSFDAGCCIVDFSLMDDLSAVPNFVAAALGLRSISTDMTSTLIDYLEHRRVLIILDHCERVMPAVRLLISRFLASSTSSAILLISLEPLRIQNESTHRIGLLSYPPPGSPLELSRAGAMAYPAVAMLVGRANAMSGYELIDGDIAAIVGLCQLMDGRPRSIVSALSNLLGRFSFDDMLGVVTRRMLHGPQVGEPEDPLCLMSGKQDFGYGRLSSDEAMLLRQLSIFAGAFELQDVVRMIEPFGWDSHKTFMVLSNIVAKSLIWVEPAGPVARYRILGAERFFGRAKLREAAGELEVASACRAQVILQVFEQAQTEWPWSEPEAWRARYAIRSEDLIEAIEWSASEGADAVLELKLTALAIRLWDEQSDLGVRGTYLERALQAGKKFPELCKAVSRIATSHAWSLTLSGKLGTLTAEAWTDAVEFAAKNGDDLCHFSALLGYCNYLFMVGQSRIVALELPKLEDLAKRARNHQFIIDVERFRAFVALDTGDINTARNVLLSATEYLEMTSPASQANRHRWERYVTMQSSLSLIEFISGPSDEVPSRLDQLEGEIKVCHPQAQAIFMITAALPIAYWCRDHHEIDRLVAIFSSCQGADKARFWEPVVQFYAAASRHLRKVPGSFDQMRELVEQLLTEGLYRRSALHLSIVAEAALEARETELAAELIKRALQQQEHCHELWYVPEVIRVEARVLCASGHPSKALNRLQTAADKAAAMGTAFFGKRIQKETVTMQMMIDARLKEWGGNQDERYEDVAVQVHARNLNTPALGQGR